MKEITLKNRGGEIVGFTLIDDEDFDTISRFSWAKTSHGYAKAKINGADVYLHRLLTSAPKGMDVDHANSNKLDNQRKNLRVCTHSQNLSNGKFRSNNTSGYKGVSEKAKGWTAALWHNGKKIYGGYLINKEEAIKRYAELSRQYHGEYGRIT